MIGLDDPELWTDRLLGLDDVNGFGEVTQYDSIEKSGRTTGVTGSGLVFSTDGDIKIKVGEDDEGNPIRVEFAPVLVSTLTTAGGDSGSLWVRSEDRSIVGLHFAGGSGVAAAIPASAVQDALGELTLADIEYETPDAPTGGDDDGQDGGGGDEQDDGSDSDETNGGDDAAGGLIGTIIRVLRRMNQNGT